MEMGVDGWGDEDGRMKEEEDTIGIALDFLAYVGVYTCYCSRHELCHFSLLPNGPCQS